MRFIDMSDYNRSTRIYWCVVVMSGICVIAYSAFRLKSLGSLEFLGIATLSILIMLSGLFPIQIPGTKASITAGDIFVFLALLFWGTAAATMVAVVDGFSASYRTSRRWTSRLASPAITAIAVYVSGDLFHIVRRVLTEIRLSDASSVLVGLLVCSLVYFFLNTMLTAFLIALKKGESVLRLWWENYAWVAMTYTASSSAAGLIFLAVNHYGFGALIAAAPIIGIVFASCYFYFKQADERTRAAESQAKQAERHLCEMRESEERFHSAFDYASIGMALVASDGKLVQVNGALCQILGYEESELLGRSFQSFMYAEDVETTTRSIAQLFANQKKANEIEQRYTHKLGHAVWTLLNASVIRDAQGNFKNFIFQVQDITDKKRAEAQLLHDAFHDVLTGLPNRALFLDHLKMALARSRRHLDRMFAVLFLDFDRFKIINDSLGHIAGDKLLIEIARRLEKSLRPGDTVARLGGDEFTVLLEDLEHPDEAIALAERIQKTLTTPISLDGNEVSITASIGIALSTIGYNMPEEILRDADTAMYQAKSLGKARHALFDKQMHSRALKQLQLENDLRRAVEREEFFVVYQPIVSLENLELAGFEALVRWQHPERGLVSPADFIPLAEETDYINPIGKWILESACRQLQKWQQMKKDLPLMMSVNLSGKQFAQGNLVEQIVEVLKATGLEPKQLKLEITESVVMDNVEAATEMLKRLRNLGVQLSIDDFGTGYSSLSYLHRLPIDTLKVDRSFVMLMTNNNENAEIVRTIVMLAKSLGMAVIAEGVETKEQMEILRELGCEYGQGYYFSKPLEPAQALKFVENMNHWQKAINKIEPTHIEQNLNGLSSNYTM